MGPGRGNRAAAAIAALLVAAAGCSTADRAPDATSSGGSSGAGTDATSPTDVPADGASDGAAGDAPIVADETVDLAEVGTFTLDATSGAGSWRVIDSEGRVNVAYLVPDADAEVTLFLPPPPADDRWTEQAIAGSGGDALDQTEVLVRIERGEELELVFDRSGG